MDALRRGLATVVLVGIAFAIADAPSARAADPVSATTYEVRPDAGVVQVTVATSEGIVPVPAAATGTTADLDGSPLPIPPGAAPVVRAPSAGMLTVTFALPHDPDGTGVHVNPAYVWFPTRVWGPGGSAVTIRVPNDFAIKVDGAVLLTDQQPGWTVMRAPEVTDPTAWAVTVSARRDIALETRIAGTEGFTYVLRWWPGEDEWADGVGAVLDEALPRLAALTGISDPIGRPLVVAQSTDPSRNGFDGWYIAATDTVELGPDPDTHVLVHEASHAWFNDNLVSERWLAEGLAETYTALAGFSERSPVAPTTSLPRLAEWGHAALVDGSTVDAERAAYAAAWWVMDRIVADVGVTGMQAVLADLATDRSAYASGGWTTTDRPADWQRFLDLVERHGASDAVGNLLTEWVVPADSGDLMAERSRAVTRLEALAADPLGWAAPVGVRQAMDAWNFTTAEAHLDAAFVALAARDARLASGASVGEFRLAYERSVVPVVAPPPMVVAPAPDPAPEAAEFVVPVAPVLWTATLIGLLVLAVGTLRQGLRVRVSPAIVPDHEPLPLVGQLELFPVAVHIDGAFTLIDLDVLHRLDEELEGIEQQVLFELPRPTPWVRPEADPWAEVMGTGGVARL